MMRNVQTNNLAVSGYEVWDVTNVTNPQLVGQMRNLRNTHKHWWECKTGIAYLPGSKAAAQVAPGPVDDRSWIGAIRPRRFTCARTACREGSPAASARAAVAAWPDFGARASQCRR